MKILQVISSFPPAYAYGGPLKMAYGISKELARRGHEVTVYTTDVYDAQCRFKQIQNPSYMDGVKVHRFRNVNNKLAHGNLAIAPMMARALDRNIANFDIAHVHETRTFQAMIVRHYANKHGIPYVLQARGSLPRIMAKRRLKMVLDVVWGYKLLRDAKVIALTEAEAQQYRSMDLTKDRIEIVPNGIDLSEFNALPQKGEFRRKYGIGDDQKLLLYLARIHKIKGPDLLAKAFAGLRGEIGDAKLVVVGPDDGYLSTLRRLIKELGIEQRVMFTGPLYGQDKLSAYVDADVYILPSFYEVFGNTALEACACGTPVMVTDRCGVADFVGRVGCVVGYDEDQLRDGLLRMLCNGISRRRLGDETKRLVGEEFGWDVIAGKLEDLYERIQNRG